MCRLEPRGEAEPTAGVLDRVAGSLHLAVQGRVLEAEAARVLDAGVALAGLAVEGVGDPGVAELDDVVRLQGAEQIPPSGF